ncbi:MAG: LacI family DNA-binding transcriptional regulator [Xanthobacteraceae bacterium]|nr:LacI family DNA-binding transcriptional regulator [Xanthobacteraceae bacterium]
MARQRTTTGKVRLTEVAKLAGVSPITASRFFRNPEALSAGKRERVESAARELGYVPDLAARALASQRTEVIGVLIPSLTNNVFSDVLRGIYDALQGSRYSIQLVNTRYSFLQEEKLLRLFQAQRPAGLVVTGINQTPDSRLVMEAMNCPIVQIMEIGPDPVDMMVGFSHNKAAFSAVSHLLARNYRRIGFLGARMDPRVQRRLEGYRDAMKAAGLYDPRLIITTPVPTSVSMGGMLFADLLTLVPDMDAVFCVNDDIALGVLFECQRRQISVPDDMAIVGFNDLEFMAAAVPPLTSVRTNRYEMGRNAISMVMAAIDGERPEAPVIDLGFQLMVRGSSSPRPA